MQTAPTTHDDPSAPHQESMQAKQREKSVCESRDSNWETHHDDIWVVIDFSFDHSVHSCLSQDIHMAAGMEGGLGLLDDEIFEVWDLRESLKFLQLGSLLVCNCLALPNIKIWHCQRVIPEPACFLDECLMNGGIDLIVWGSIFQTSRNPNEVNLGLRNRAKSRFRP